MRLYHRLFDHPGMVAQLLREFVAEPWLDDLDLDGMERLNAKFHADTGERREGDIIWRILRIPIVPATYSDHYPATVTDCKSGLLTAVSRQV
jgi:hypothetical protein